MNTKLLMTSSSLMLGTAGLFALFMPDALLPAQANPLPGQLLGALYFAFAIMNWTAKDSAIGGIYARPVSLANFSHFLSGSLVLANRLCDGFSPVMILLTVVYAVYAVCFYWLVFRATGLN